MNGVRCWTTAALLLAAAEIAAPQVIVVPNFVVHDDGVEPDVAVGSDGTMLFVWRNDAGAPNTDLSTRHYAADGTALGPAVQISTHGRAFSPRIDADAGGGYAVNFRYLEPNPTFRLTLHGRRLGADGSAEGLEFRIDAPLYETSVGFAEVAGTSTGVLHVWGQETALWFRFYDLAGAPLSPPIQAATAVHTSVHDVAVLADGGFALGWLASAASASWLRLFEANGQPRTAAIPLVSGFHIDQLAADPRGGFALVGRGPTAIRAARFAADGSPDGAAFDVVATVAVSGDPDVALDSNGNLYVPWSAWTFAFSQPGPVYARGFDLQNQPLGDPVALNSAPVRRRLRTARLPHGTFVNTWSEGGAVWANVVSLCAPGSSTCGDGILQPVCETCDDGGANSDTTPDACRTTCRRAGCGDSVVDAAEECDDGNLLGRDGCDQHCLLEICGNGRREASERCDDGNLDDGDGCDSDCTFTECGNGILTAGEECEDANVASGDGCDESCLVEDCGNGRREANEICDDGNQLEGDGCDTNCTVSACGNLVVSPVEECDDGGTDDGDGCDATCLQEICGNGRRESNESCDDGNVADDDGCQSNCTPTPPFDTVLQPIRPLKASIPPSTPSTTVRVRLRVRHGASGGLQVVRLSATDGTCPPGTVIAAPDFAPGLAGTQDLAALGPGQRAAAVLDLRLSRADFTFADRRTPARCAVRVTASAPAGYFDPSLSNNVADVVVDVFDGAAAGTPAAEFVVRPVPPRKLTIGPGRLGAERRLSVRVKATPAAALTLVATDGDCPLGTLAILQQPGNSGGAKVLLRASRSFVTTSTRVASLRCTAGLTVSAAAADADASNNHIPVVVDMIDLNDL